MLLSNKLILLPLIFFFFLFFSSPVLAANYYVSTTGSDSNPGTQVAPWKTLSKVNSISFQPGDTILFERNGIWDGPGLTGVNFSNALQITRSGVSGSPITYGAYGSGNAPIIENPGDAAHQTRAIMIQADWIVIQGLMLKNSHEAGILDQGNHTIIQDNEITSVGDGVLLQGQYNLVTRNYFHDLTMVINTPGGDDDYGATGVIIYASNNEISNNKMINCQAPSLDYGMDGGVVEIYGDTNNVNVHHNWGASSNGFMEVTASHAVNNVIAYNVSYNNNNFMYFHYATPLGFLVANNTVVETAVTSQYVVFGFGTNPGSGFILRNNLFYVGNYYRLTVTDDSSSLTFTHDHNLYQFLNSGTTLGYTIGTGEKIISLGLKNPANGDFHLTSTSPAIGTGVSLGYTTDLDGVAVPSIPDIGAYEYVGSNPTSTPVPTSTPTPPCPLKSFGDTNCSGTIDITDLNYLLNHYGTSDIGTDLDSSGKVNLLDLSILIRNFGRTG